MSLLFHTDNDSLSLEQLKAKGDADASERFRLIEEFQRLETAEGECRSIDKFDRSDLIGKMIEAGLLEVDDKSALAPTDRLLLAQRRYLEEELDCLIEMQGTLEWTPRRLAFRRSANYERLSDISVGCSDLGKTKEDKAPALLIDAEEEMTIRAPLSRTTITAAPATSNSESGWRYYRSFEELTIEERNARLKEVKNRYASMHSPCGLSEEEIQLKTDKQVHVFDPTSDLGILITYGCQDAPPAMQILADDVILVEAGRLLMGLTPELPNKESLMVRSVRSAKVHAHRCGSLIMTKFELLDLVKRYTLQHKGKRIVDVMPVFDPDTDLGKLILWGKYTPSPAMQISLPHRQQINEFRAACGLTPLNFSKFAHVPTNVKSLVTSNPSFSSFASQLSQYQSFKAYPNLVQELSTAAEALEGEDMDAVLVRYIYASSGGKTQVDTMPIFDPTCDLGRLILAGRKSLSKKVTVPPEHVQLLAERLATVQQQRLRVQRLLQQIQELDYLIASAQRANIPKKWLYLARGLPSVDDEEESEEASLGVASAQLLAASSSTVTAVNCPDQCQKATLSVPLENGAVDCCKSKGIVLNANVKDVFNWHKTSTTSPDLLSPAIEAVFTTAVHQSNSADTTNEDGIITPQSAKESIGVMHSMELQKYSTKEQTRECAVLEPIQYDHDQAPESFNLAVAGLTGATSCDTSQTDPVEEYLAALNELTFINTIHLDDPEINGLTKSMNLTVGQLKLMPVFDPRSALGRLILADRQPMHKGISVPPQYAQLLQESHATVRNRRARARHLLQQVHSLGPLVPAEQRMKIPTRWEFLARDPVWCRDGTAASSPHDNSVPLTRKEKKMRKRNRAVEDEHNGSMEFAPNKRPTVLQPSTMNAGVGAHQNQRSCVENRLQGQHTLLPTPTRAAQTPRSATVADCADSRAIHSLVSVGTAKKEPVKTLEASTTGDTHFQAQNIGTGGDSTKIDIMESEVIHDIVLSEQDVIRLELARMKKMYDDWLSQ